MTRHGPTRRPHWIVPRGPAGLRPGQEQELMVVEELDDRRKGRGAAPRQLRVLLLGLCVQPVLRQRARALQGAVQTPRKVVGEDAGENRQREDGNRQGRNAAGARDPLAEHHSSGARGEGPEIHSL